MGGFGLGLLISVIAGLVAATQARATPVQGTFGFASPSLVIDFSAISSAPNATTLGVPITNQYAGSGVQFTGLYASNTTEDQQVGGAVVSPAAITDGTGITSFTITFSTPQTDAVFYLYTTGGASIASFLNGTPVETATMAASSYSVTGANYYGFAGSSGFDTITLTTVDTEVALVDNLQIGLAAVPEPRSATVLAAGVAGLMMFGARRRS